MKPALLIVAMLAAPPGPAHQWSLASPDGRTSIVVALTGGRLTWHVTHGSAAMLSESPLGIRRADQSFVDGLTFVSASNAAAIDEIYSTPHGKRHDHHVRGRERTLQFANSAGARLELVTVLTPIARCPTRRKRSSPTFRRRGMTHACRRASPGARSSSRGARAMNGTWVG